jgi:hypothetical protein
LDVFADRAAITTIMMPFEQPMNLAALFQSFDPLQPEGS